MYDLIQDLLEYFENTSKIQQRKDWEELAVYGRVGPTASEYLNYILGGLPKMEINNQNENPEYNLDFLCLNRKNFSYEQCCI